MIALHPSKTEVEQYVLGMLAAAPHAQFERHIARCTTCAKSLAEEARLEMTLRALMPHVHRQRHLRAEPVRRREPRNLSGFSTLAVAAGLLFVAMGGSRRAPGVVVPISQSGGQTLAMGDSSILACSIDGEAPLCVAPTLSSRAPAHERLMCLPSDGTCR